MRWWLAGLGVAVAGAVAVGVLVLVTATSSRTLVLDLDTGDCFDVDLEPGSARLELVDETDCDGPHLAEVVAVGELDPDGDTPRPPDDEVLAVVDARCATVLADRPDVLERFGVVPVVADEASWTSFAGRYVCVVIPYGGEPTSGSALD